MNIALFYFHPHINNLISGHSALNSIKQPGNKDVHMADSQGTIGKELFWGVTFHHLLSCPHTGKDFGSWLGPTSYPHLDALQHLTCADDLDLWDKPPTGQLFPPIFNSTSKFALRFFYPY